MEDYEIVKLYLDRKEIAINETKVKYGRAIYSTAYNFLGNREDAEECENDTYFEAWKSIPPCVPDFLLAYLLKINRCRAMDKVDYKNAQKRKAVVCELEQCIGDKCLGKCYIDGYIDREHVLQVIDDFLYCLDKEKRIVFIKRYWYGKSICQICAEMCMAPGRVKMMLYRMRNSLRESLKGENDGYGQK